MLDRRLDEAIPFQWHHHPEFELTLTLNSRGERFIGDHVGSYDHGDLVLVGPNLPHTWLSREKVDKDQPHVALVFWFHADWIGPLTKGSVELAPVAQMIGQAGSGLAFGSALGCLLAPAFEAMSALGPAQRLVGLLDILIRLAAHKKPEPLSSAASLPSPDSRQRIDKVMDHLYAHYREPVRISELADVAALSTSGLHRMFQRHTQMTISTCLMRLRIGEACARLSAMDEPVQHVAGVVGYNSLANFNRQFKAIRGMTPKAYRALFRD